MVALITNAGLALDAQARVSNTPVVIDQVQGGLTNSWGGADLAAQRQAILTATRMASRENPVLNFPTPADDPNIHAVSYRHLTLPTNREV